MTDPRSSMSKRITHIKPLPGLELLTYATLTPGVVTLLGSFLGGDTFAPIKQTLLPDIVANLLDRGTKKRKKEDLRDELESLGAVASFWSRGDRVGFSVSAMPEDVEKVIQLLSEELRESTFPQSELDLVKHQYASSLHEEKNDTVLLASGEFSRALYPKGHPNYLPSISERARGLKSIKRSDVVQFYEAHYGRNAMLIATVGDVKDLKRSGMFATAFKNLPEKHSVVPAHASIPRSRGGKRITTVRDKMSVDVILGHELPLTQKDPLYYPLLVLIHLLGASGFTSHLFQTVRERDGLTYHIRAGLSGFEDGNQGHWFVRATFAPTLFLKGVESIQKEVVWFLKNGLTDKAIEKKKVELIGAYAVSLGTTRGIASTILWTQEEGLPLSWIDDYPKILSAVTPSLVRRAAELLEPERITIRAAGSIDKSGSPL